MNLLPYTVDSFIRLTEVEARRGQDPTRIDPIVQAQIEALSLLGDTYTSSRKQLFGNSVRLEKLHSDYLKSRNQLRTQRDEAFRSAIAKGAMSFEAAISRNLFSWRLSKGPILGKRSTYCIPRDLEWHLPARQAADVIRNAAALTPLSRNSIVRALKHSLLRTYEHSIIRLDIEDFFASISHDILIKKLSQSRNVDSITVNLMEVLLKEYSLLTGDKKGLPQGVGLSSHLAELYLSNFDIKIRSLPEVLFYARYVDDVIIVIDSKKALKRVGDQVDSLLTELELNENSSKSSRFSTNEKGDYPGNRAFEYLGYAFLVSSKVLTTSLTARRLKIRKARMNRAFETWSSKTINANKPNHGADGLLTDRIRYLTGNTKLAHSKSNVAIGIYFSNSALDITGDDLKALDGYLEAMILKHAPQMSPALVNKLKTCSFRSGFANRTFLHFTQKRIERIVACWKDVS